MKRLRAKIISKKYRRPKLRKSEIGEGSRRLALTGAVVPAGYDVHKNSYGRTKSSHLEKRKRTSDEGSRPITPTEPLEKIAAGAVGKRPATWEDVKAIAARVRVGADVSSHVAAVYLTEPQREVIREANRQYASQFRNSKHKLKRWRNRGSQDIYRRGIRLSGSFQSTC